MDDATPILELPDDPVLLKRLIVQVKREAAEQIEAMSQRHKAEMDAVLRRFYDPHAERFDPTQLLLLLLFGITIDQLPVDPRWKPNRLQTVPARCGESIVTSCRIICRGWRLSTT